MADPYHSKRFPTVTTAGLFLGPWRTPITANAPGDNRYTSCFWVHGGPLSQLEFFKFLEAFKLFWGPWRTPITAMAINISLNNIAVFGSMADPYHSKFTTSVRVEQLFLGPWRTPKQPYFLQNCCGCRNLQLKNRKKNEEITSIFHRNIAFF